MSRMTLALTILIASALFAPLAAQPADGDLILTIATGLVGPNSVPTSGFTAYAAPGGTGPLTTIATAPSNSVPTWVRMAPDNKHLVISQATVTSINPVAGYSHLVRIDPSGMATTMTSTALTGVIPGFELDHDNQWVAVANDIVSRTHLVGVDDSTGAVTTFANLLAPTNPGLGGFSDVAIDRDPGAAVYAAVWHPRTTSLSKKIVGVDRQGNVTTIVATAGTTLQAINAIELHPRSGDYVVVGQAVGPNDPIASRVTKGGVITSMNTGTIALGNNARISQDDTAWVTGRGSQLTSTTVAHYDFPTNTVIATRTVNHPSGVCTALEIYGSRPLTCNGTGKPGTTVTVSIQSQRLNAGSARYALAASFARRPGVQLGNGEWLDLAQDALFLLSAQNLAPSVFQNFQGTLDPFGAAKAQVNIPAALKSGLDITVFVAGVIYNNQGIVEVTPSHWLVLS